MAEIKLIKVTYQQRRLDFFKKQLDKATRSMNYHVKRKHHSDICAEYGEIASFYEWAVDKAKEPGWIPVSERLPDMELEAVMVEDMDLFPCLVCKNVTIPRKRKLVTKAWYDGKGFMDIDCMDITDETTHWMPLPEPPQEK